MARKTRRHWRAIDFAGATLREYRPGRFMVDRALPGGRRERRVFKTLEQAKEHAARLRGMAASEGAEAFVLNSDQRRDAARAVATASGRVSLAAAVAFWMKHHPAGDAVTVAQLAERWHVAQAANGCRPRTIQSAKHRTARFVAVHGGRPAQSVTREIVRQYLDGTAARGYTLDNHRCVLRAMFNYAVAEQVTDSNPVAGIARPRRDEVLPEPFTLAEVTALLRAAHEHYPEALPFVAVGALAGLRPNEAHGLRWEDVDFTEKLIRVRPEVSKVRRTRSVEMCDALAAWLMPHRKASGPMGMASGNVLRHVLHRRERDGKRGLLAAAGLKSWRQDGLRKTYASWHFALGQDAAKTAAQLGHTSGLDVFYRHYRGLWSKRDAAALLALRPDKRNVLELSRRRRIA